MKVKKTNGRKDQLDLVRLVHKTTRPPVCSGLKWLSHLALNIWPEKETLIQLHTLGVHKTTENVCVKSLSIPGAVQ